MSSTRSTFSIARWLLLAGLIGAGASAAVEPATKSRVVIDDRVYEHPQRLVDIGGRKMNLYCTGSGAPTIILESGLADPTAVWGLIQPVLARRTRICSYDRAGIGFSEPSGRASTSEHVVEDLHALLRAASIAAPYILVGHSFGGLNVRLYAHRHASEVAGLVLIDPAHEDQVARYARANGGPDPKRVERLERHRRCVEAAAAGLVVGTQLYDVCIDPPSGEPNVFFSSGINTSLAAIQARPAFQNAQLSEYENVLGLSAGQVRATRRSFGALPLIVLTREDRAGEKAEIARARWQMHEELAALSVRGAHKAAPGSGHYIQFDRPDLVLAAIDEVMASVARP